MVAGTIVNEKTFEWVNKELFRRVKVENELWLCFFGKRDLPTREECKEWALTLGVPEDIREEINKIG